MRVTSVESTALATVGYDEALELLQVEFRGRAIYRYFGVPAAVHQALLGAPSKGGDRTVSCWSRSAPGATPPPRRRPSG